MNNDGLGRGLIKNQENENSLLVSIKSIQSITNNKCKEQLYDISNTFHEGNIDQNSMNQEPLNARMDARKLSETEKVSIVCANEDEMEKWLIENTWGNTEDSKEEAILEAREGSRIRPKSELEEEAVTESKFLDFLESETSGIDNKRKPMPLYLLKDSSHIPLAKKMYFVIRTKENSSVKMDEPEKFVRLREKYSYQGSITVQVSGEVIKTMRGRTLTKNESLFIQSIISQVLAEIDRRKQERADKDRKEQEAINERDRATTEHNIKVNDEKQEGVAKEKTRIPDRFETLHKARASEVMYAAEQERHKRARKKEIATQDLNQALDTKHEIIKESVQKEAVKKSNENQEMTRSDGKNKKTTSSRHI